MANGIQSKWPQNIDVFLYLKRGTAFGLAFAYLGKLSCPVLLNGTTWKQAVGLILPVHELLKSQRLLPPSSATEESPFFV